MLKLRKKLTVIMVISLVMLIFTSWAQAEERIDSLLKSMSLEEKVGQVMIGFFQGPELSADLEQMIRKNHLGGVILYSASGNIKDVNQVGELVKSIQECSISSGQIPLFVSIDQEGGRVVRLTEGVTLFPGNMALGATGSERLARKAAAITAQELRILGINMNFAPVLDVNSNPNNPIIGVRSFGSSPKEVACLGVAMLASYQKEEVICSAKHFPGHGDTSIDSHVGLPRINHSRQHLEKVELFPFRAMVKAGVPAVMTAHVVVPALSKERDYPATLSPSVLKFLREEIGFDGLIITDSLGMGAVNKRWSIEETAINAFLAGADILILGADKGHEPKEQEAVFKALLEAIQKGKISQARLDQSVRRIITAKVKYNIIDNPFPLYKSFTQLAKPEHLAVAQEVAKKSLTLVRNEQRFLPLSKMETVTILWPEERKDSLELLKKECPFLKPYLVPLKATPNDISRVVEQLAKESRLVVGTYDLHRNPAWIDLIQALGAKKKLILAMDSPYDLMQVPEVGTYVAAYSDRPVTMVALGKLLKGETLPQGRLPVEIPGLYKRGWGMENF